MPNPAESERHVSRIGVDVRRFPWIRRMAADYAFDFRALAPFFSGDPADEQSWKDAIRRTHAHSRHHQQIALIVAAQQERRGAPPQAVQAARQLGDSQTVSILTGQQAGLFGGPLFTLLKALTAIKLARHISKAHGVTAVPVFWVDAEDHDWDEVRSCTVLDEGLTPRTVSLPSRPAADPPPVATIQLDDSITAAVAALEEILPATEFRAELLASLRTAYTPGFGAADAFARWLERVLGPHGLVVYDSSDAASKPLAAPVFQRELSAPGQTIMLAGQAGSTLESSGYHAQVQSSRDGVALFRLDGGRRPIRRQNGEFLVGEERYAAAALVGEAADHPSMFSPNVLLRPIVQDTLFPTICYVAGPNELAYLGQLRGVYEHFGVPMPLMYPRLSATIVDGPALRFLQKYNVALESLQPQDDAGLNELLKSQIPASVERSLAEASRAVAESMTGVVRAVPTLDPTLEGAAKSTLGRMQHDLETLNGKIIQAAKRRDETLRRQYTRTRALVFPNGHAQEREIGFLSFLNQYGPALVECLLDDLPLDMGHHSVVSI